MVNVRTLTAMLADKEISQKAEEKTERWKWEREGRKQESCPEDPQGSGRVAGGHRVRENTSKMTSRTSQRPTDRVMGGGPMPCQELWDTQAKRALLAEVGPREARE